MDNSQTPSDLIAARVRKLRKDRGLTVADLAARCRDAGMPRLTAQALYKLEGQRDVGGRKPRPVTVDELLVLAYVLDVAPVHLIAGLDDATPLPVSPRKQADPAGARKWIRGLAPLEGGDARQFEVNQPAAEANTRWFVVRDVTSYEALEHAIEGIRAFVSLARWQDENEAPDGARYALVRAPGHCAANYEAITAES